MVPEQPSYDALLAGAGSGGVVFKGKEAMEGLGAFEGERKVGKDRKRKLLEWDRMLKDFRYGDALDSVLRKVRLRSVAKSCESEALTHAKFLSKGHHPGDDVCPSYGAHPPGWTPDRPRESTRPLP